MELDLVLKLSLEVFEFEKIARIETKRFKNWKKGPKPQPKGCSNKFYNVKIWIRSSL
jgi:hypothetical protein